MTVIAVFRSRSQCLDFAERLYKYGVRVATLPAPKEAKIGCGLCVRFDYAAFPKVKAVLKIGKYDTFKGFYKADYSSGRLVYLPC